MDDNTDRPSGNRKPAPYVDCIVPWLSGGETSTLPSGARTSARTEPSSIDAASAGAPPSEKPSMVVIDGYPRTPMHWDAPFSGGLVDRLRQWLRRFSA
jgi:hypothetical protein